MKGKNVYYLLFAVVIIGGVYGYYKFDREKKKEHPQITELAVEPDQLMNTADEYLHEHKRLTSLQFLEDAIAMMKLLEKDGDSVSMEAIEVAISDLEIVEDHIRSNDVNDEMMYEAFADAMNSLAYASLRVSEVLINEGKEEEAAVTLEHAMDHLQNSIKYARGDQKEDGIRIVHHLKSLIENHLENDISEIDAVMAEIDSLVKAHVIR